jgi:hypothetical protein
VNFEIVEKCFPKRSEDQKPFKISLDSVSHRTPDLIGSRFDYCENLLALDIKMVG